jgi:hypothetical protein
MQWKPPDLRDVVLLSHEGVLVELRLVENIVEITGFAVQKGICARWNSCFVCRRIVCGYRSSEPESR